MKNVLITGTNSFIGESLKNWLSASENQYKVMTLDMEHNDWKSVDFKIYDVVVHLAALVHKHDTIKHKAMYYKVNYELAVEAAAKAKSDGVSQFVFLSTMSVYGIDKGKIDSTTISHPTSYYGKSKLKAENEIKKLEDSKFHVAILRPPMVYGAGCKGNYPLLVKFTKLTPVFPMVNNLRSMIYIDNLCEFIKVVIDDYMTGIFFPQNSEYLSTTDLVKEIASAHNKKIIYLKWLKWFIKPIGIMNFNKRFEDLTYDKEMSLIHKEYCVVEFRESIALTEQGNIK